MSDTADMETTARHRTARRHADPQAADVDLLTVGRELIDARITAAIASGATTEPRGERMRRLVWNGTADSLERVARWVDVLDSREQPAQATAAP